MTDPERPYRKRNVGMLVTCLVDLFRPSVGLAAVRLLEHADCHVDVPPSQTCCGLPLYNLGDRTGARALAEKVIQEFGEFEYVVVPSASCAAMIQKQYGALLGTSLGGRSRAERLIRRTHELVGFLTDVCGMDRVQATWSGKVVCHDNCSALRELRVQDKAHRLLQSVNGLTVCPLRDSEACCGFGGTFAVKYPEISERMVQRKIACVRDSGASTLVSTDMGCLLQMASRLKHEGATVSVRHVAELLAGFSDRPGIEEG